MTPLGWLGIVRLGSAWCRLGLVQAGLGAVVVLATATLNRVMVIELALPALIPGALVAFHYGVQVLRPRLGYGSDLGGRRTPWILGGMAALAVGGAGVCAGGFGRWGGGDGAADVAGEAGGGGAAPAGGDGGLIDDDRGDRGDGDCGRAVAGPVFAGAAGGGRVGGFLPGVCGGRAGGLGCRGGG